ncbi:MAG: 23S rRNA (adenine(2503)-C(2))-methyltransferase RlmN [Chloroflexota bacterium]|nr:MAG: 23S rRNA (adenine(2503)-C(2))-methyltransferase RlmN [Chloroflexota bacterium]
MTPEQIAEAMVAIGEPAFRGRQIAHWIYPKHAAAFAEMSDLPAELRTRLAESFAVSPVTAVHIESSDDERTEKALFSLGPIAGRLAEGPLAERRARFNTVEAVYMEYPGRGTVCVSSQAGCAMGCVFCATGQAGYIRDLEPGEIVGQALHFARVARERRGPDGRVTNIVFMGQGEPMMNFDRVWGSIELLHRSDCFGLGARHITVSTVGIVPGIRRLATMPLPVNLAVSLHAADDALRGSLVPVNRRFPIGEIMSACRDYIAATRRRVSFEYTCIDGVNDRDSDAESLARLLRGMLCHVNLIALNPGGSPAFAPSSRERVRSMASVLNARGVTTTIRDTRGQSISAACGQLRARVLADAS